MINKNGNTLYCKPCSDVQKEFKRAMNFFDDKYNTLSMERKTEMFNKIIKADTTVVWRKLLL